MHIDDIDEVIMHRNHRRKAMELRNGAKEGTLGAFTIWHAGREIDVFSVISAMPVREAISRTCDEFIAEKEQRLASLGVEYEPRAALTSA